VIEDHDVRILDMRLDKKLSSMLEDFAPDIVGFAAYTVHVNTVRPLARCWRNHGVPALACVRFIEITMRCGISLSAGGGQKRILC